MSLIDKAKQAAQTAVDKTKEVAGTAAHAVEGAAADDRAAARRGVEAGTPRFGRIGERLSSSAGQPVFPSLFRSLPLTFSALPTTASVALPAISPAPATALAPTVLAFS